VLFVGNNWDNIVKWGSFALSHWVPESNTEALWRVLADATIDIVATDHAPHTREEKEVGRPARAASRSTGSRSPAVARFRGVDPGPMISASFADLRKFREVVGLWAWRATSPREL
jgi:hypothetical protein